MSRPHVKSVQQITEHHIECELDVPTDLPEFQGHFPGAPILPGVVQVDWVVQLAALHLKTGEPVARDFKVKFAKIIRPQTPLSLTLERDATRENVKFTYRSEGETMSSGQIKLKA